MHSFTCKHLPKEFGKKTLHSIELSRVEHDSWKDIYFCGFFNAKRNCVQIWNALCIRTVVYNSSEEEVYRKGKIIFPLRTRKLAWPLSRELLSNVSINYRCLCQAIGDHCEKVNSHARPRRGGQGWTLARECSGRR